MRVSSDGLKEPVNKPFSGKIAALATFADDYSEVLLGGLTMDFLLHFLAICRLCAASNGQFRAVFRHQELRLRPGLDAATASSLLATRAGIP